MSREEAGTSLDMEWCSASASHADDLACKHTVLVSITLYLKDTLDV